MLWFRWVLSASNSRLKTLVWLRRTPSCYWKHGSGIKGFCFHSTRKISHCLYRAMKIVYTKHMSLLELLTLLLNRTGSDVSVVFEAEFCRSKPITVFYRLLIVALVEGRWSSTAKIRPPIRCSITHTVMLQLHVLIRARVLDYGRFSCLLCNPIVTKLG